MERSFSEPFTIGRGMQATLHVDSGRVSRIHAEVTYEANRWVLKDAGSTNGTYYEGERIEAVPLKGEMVVRLGREGPAVYLTVMDEEQPTERNGIAGGGSFLRGRRSDDEDDRSDRTTKPQTPPIAYPFASEDKPPQRPLDPPRSAVPPASSESPAEPTSRGAGAERGADDLSASKVMRRYFEADSDEPAGERTRMIRQAYQIKTAEHKRTYTGIIAGIAVLLIAALGFAIWQQFRVERLEGVTQDLFYEMRAQDVRTAQLRALAVETGNAALEAQLDDLEERRRRQAELYEGYIEELGLYRELSPQEQEIYRTARIFNESEFTMPAGFVREVQATIREWQSSSRFENAIRRAEESGYTARIVRAMQEVGLPPEFFYLALQESNFDPCAVGPQTRWGIAKGMWQFIPTTARAYGLSTGPRVDLRTCDPLDDRHDFGLATDAAARYLLFIYTELAQASGLLVMASYNWGEHRVAPKLNQLPETPLDLVRQDFADVPENPQQRSYWRFLSEYRDRMPEETKGYVLHIFAAAVIGQNPRLFGFDFDNPLEPYL